MTYFWSFLFSGVFHYIVGLLFSFIWVWEIRTSHLKFSVELLVPLILFLTTYSASSLWIFFSHYTFISLPLIFDTLPLPFISTFCRGLIFFPFMMGSSGHVLYFNYGYGIHFAELTVKIVLCPCLCMAPCHNFMPTKVYVQLSFFYGLSLHINNCALFLLPQWLFLIAN